MSEEFFRFPHTPHLIWLGDEPPRADKVLDPVAATEFLRGQVIVEEKVDGANVGFSVSPTGALRIQNRGAYLGLSAHPQFQPLWPWLDARRTVLTEALGPDLTLFGEWCFAVHSVRYDHLADWFLGFDVYDRRVGKFWSTGRRDKLLAQLGLASVPRVAAGHFTAEQVRALLGKSMAGSNPAEGIYLRRESDDWLTARAKVVRPEFVQQIEEHWKSRPLERNTLEGGSR